MSAPATPATVSLAQRAYRRLRHELGLIAVFGSTFRRAGRPRTAIVFGAGLGDQLLCTAILRELRQRGRRGLWVLSDYAELFALNGDVDAVVPARPELRDWAARAGAELLAPAYARNVPAEDRDIPPERHIIAIMCQQSGIRGPVVLRPYLALSAAERASGQLAPRQIAIQSSGLSARYPMRNKEWYPERFQAVADALAPRFQLIQLGAAADPPIQGALDLRGRTTLRQSAAILSQSLAFVGQVGFLMHLARAVDCRSAIVYGGRELPEQSGYTCNENLTSAPECAPCWQWNTCAFDRQCMRAIEPQAVIAAVERLVARHGLPLELDTDTLP